MPPRDEGGQLILLTGILLVLAFVLFSSQIALVANIGQQAGRESRNPVLEDYVDLRRSLRNTMMDEITGPTGAVECPTDLVGFRARVDSLLVMFSVHEANRALFFSGSVTGIAVNDSDPMNRVLEVDVTLALGDGFTHVRDTPRFFLPCA